MLDLLFCLNYYWNRPIDFQVSIAHFLLNIELSYRCFVYNEGRVISDMYSLKSALNSLYISCLMVMSLSPNSTQMLIVYRLSILSLRLVIQRFNLQQELVMRKRNLTGSMFIHLKYYIIYRGRNLQCRINSKLKVVEHDALLDSSNSVDIFKQYPHYHI